MSRSARDEGGELVLQLAVRSGQHGRSFAPFVGRVSPLRPGHSKRPKTVPLDADQYPRRHTLRAVASTRPSIIDPAVFRPLHVASCKVQCSNCNLREICLPVGLTREELEHIDNRLVVVAPQAGARRDAVSQRRSVRRPVRRLDRLLQDRGHLAPGTRAGHGLPDGRRADRPRRHRHGPHEVDAIALEDSQVCVIPYGELESLAREVPALQTAVPQDHEPRDRRRPPGDAPARQHARGGARRRVPAQPDASPAGAGLFGLVDAAAHEPRGDRELSRAASSRR